MNRLERNLVNYGLPFAFVATLLGGAVLRGEQHPDPSGNIVNFKQVDELQIPLSQKRTLEFNELGAFETRDLGPNKVTMDSELSGGKHNYYADTVNSMLETKVRARFSDLKCVDNILHADIAIQPDLSTVIYDNEGSGPIQRDYFPYSLGNVALYRGVLLSYCAPGTEQNVASLNHIEILGVGYPTDQ